jgi:signal peptidase II
MKREDWVIVFFPLAVTWALDRLSKMWAVGIQGPITHSEYLHFVLHHNKGAMLGLFSDLPEFLRIVSLSTAGAFLVCIYALIQFLLPIRTMKLRTGLSIVLGGIMGNVTDRILWGEVVDFIVLGNERWQSPVFNIADAMQWVGYALILVGVFKDGDLIWPENNIRKQYWVNRNFQLKYCGILLGVGLGISLVTMVFSFTYIRVALIDLLGENDPRLNKYLMPYAQVFALISVGFSLGLFTVGKVISHKIAGPIFAFERSMLETLRNLDAGKDMRHLKLRAKDEFKQLEALHRQIQDKLIELRGPIAPGESELAPAAPDETLPPPVDVKDPNERFSA